MNAGPRVVRPRTDSGLWPMTAVGTLLALGVGYLGGLRIFKPAPPSESTQEGEGDDLASLGDAGVADARADAHVQVAVVPVVDAAVAVKPEPPSVPIRMEQTILQSCGDGDELGTVGNRCSVTPGLEDVLKKHLLAKLGLCASAPTAALKPDKILSIGLRIDFTHRRVAALPGQSSTVSNALTFVPCARGAFDEADDLWKLQPGHPRYLYFFKLHFGPLPADWNDRVAAASGAGPAAPPPNATNVTPPPAQVDPPAQVMPPPAPTARDAGAPAVATGTTPPDTTAPGSDAGTFPMYELTHPHDVTVAWDVAIIRAAPNTASNVVARFIKGAPLHTTHRSGSWLLVRWRNGQGWVFKDAIGEP